MGKEYDRGRYDGKNDEGYNRPHDKSPLRTLIDWDTEKEIEDRLEYKRGYEDGKKSR